MAKHLTPGEISKAFLQKISNLLANFGASEQVLKTFSKELVSTKLPSPTAHRRQRETNHPTLT